MTAKSSICVTYLNLDGWHVFRSPDLPGLYVASQDAGAAFNDVGPSIQMLLKLDLGIDCKVVPETPLREFLAARHSKSRDGGVVLESRRFVLERLAA